MSQLDISGNFLCYNLKNIQEWAYGSVVERRPDKTKVDGSIPSTPTLESEQTSFDSYRDNSVMKYSKLTS